MASKLQALQSKACQASQFVAKHGTSYYKQMLEQNKQYIQQPATVEKCNELAKQLFYTRLASIPQRTESFWKEVDYVKHIWRNRQELKVEDAGIAALFGLECFAWYCAAIGIRYGKYCGVGWTGCPGEKPCDDLDACCQIHDDCVEKKGMTNVKCHEKFKRCIKKVQKSGKPGFSRDCPYDTAVPTMEQGMDMAILFSQFGNSKLEL